MKTLALIVATSALSLGACAHDKTTAKNMQPASASGMGESVTYTYQGKSMQGWRPTPEAVQRWEAEGKVRTLGGLCTCGNDPFCDPATHRVVRCVNITADRCELYITAEYCNP